MTEYKLPPLTVEEIVINPAEIPWGVQHINAPKAWNVTEGEDVIVAILDTGIDSTHSDLADKVIAGRNFTADFNADVNNFQDNHGHGTHCAGIIGANLNGNGVAGVAPKVKFIIGKVLTGNGSGSYNAIISGISWATNWRGPNGEKADIISMSLGGSQNIPQLHQAIQAAVATGMVVVCAAGNDGDGNVVTNEFDYPGAYDEVIEVGAIDQNDNVAHFSNTNPELDVVAPGVDIVSTMPGGKYAKMSGTSMATPHVAGAVALIINAYKKIRQNLTVNDIRNKLNEYARSLNNNVDAVGKGVIDFGVKDLPGAQPVQPPPVIPQPDPKPVIPVPPVDDTPKPQPEPLKPAPVEPAKVLATIDGKAYVLIGPFDTEDKAKAYIG